MNDILDVIDTRSSIRKYEDKMIPADVCRKLVEAGLKAPTATNKQEIHITVVTKDNPVQQEIQSDMNPDAEVNFYYDAPVTLYLSALESFKWSAVDAGIAVENIHLAAAGICIALTGAGTPLAFITAAVPVICPCPRIRG